MIFKLRNQEFIFVMRIDPKKKFWCIKLYIHNKSIFTRCYWWSWCFKFAFSVFCQWVESLFLFWMFCQLSVYFCFFCWFIQQMKNILKVLYLITNVIFWCIFFLPHLDLLGRILVVPICWFFLVDRSSRDIEGNDTPYSPYSSMDGFLCEKARNPIHVLIWDIDCPEWSLTKYDGIM